MLNSGTMILTVYIIRAVCIFAAVAVFEFSKALAAYKCGDNMPKQYGRLTINPVKHFEPIGFLLFLFTGYGWGKPVETSNVFTRDFGKGVYTNRKICTAVVYAAPMIVSLVLGLAFAFAAGFAEESIWAYLLLYELADTFMSLFVFNIIPVYPLCGSKILKVLLNPNASLKFSQYEKILQMLVVFLLLLGFITVPLNAVKSFLIGLVKW